ADVPNVLVVPASLGVKTLEDFVKYGKANPGKVNYASTGVGTTSHLASFLFASRAGFEAVHVPYKGADALKDLLTGRVQYMFATIPSVISHIHAGTLVAIAVSSTKRSRSLPEVPTVAESGYPGFDATSWFGMFAPKGTPPEIINILNKTTNDIIAEKNVEKRMVEEGADPVPGSPQQFGEFVRRETEKWREVVKQSGASAN
ncbi:MAG TPA: tripartite tricarboxylate transporter substrate-binding protein, partial [Usitatibacter sp.]|nr:tripartite tricarboxylate transporter substrate-binding protein [Usitatibacter sp.]